MGQNKNPISPPMVRPVGRKWFRRLWVRLLLAALAVWLIPFVLYRGTHQYRTLVRIDFSSTNAKPGLSPSPAQVPGSSQGASHRGVDDGEAEVRFDSKVPSWQSDQKQNQPRRELRLAIWNIAHGRGDGDSNWEQGGAAKKERVAKIAATIATFNADVVVLNEVDFESTWSGGVDQANMIAKIAEFPVCVKQANLDFGFLWGRWFFGNAILSRFPIGDSQVVSLQARHDWESWLVGKKRGVSCSVRLPSGDQISLVGLHLESRGESIRVQQVDDVTRHCGTLKHPLVVAGDLNTTPSHFPNAQFSGEGTNAFDRLVKQTQFSRFNDDAGDRSAMTFPTRDPKMAIDWVLVGPELELVNVEVIQSSLSDHRPVVATIRIK